MMSFDQLCWLTQIASTWYMTGLIWFVQVVHYPLMAAVGREAYPEYQRRHQTLTTWVVGPAMLVEAATALYLCWRPPVGCSLSMCILGAVLLLVIWLSTAFLQIPYHESLGRGFDSAVHRRLVLSNWLRTILWTVRAGLVLYCLRAVETDP